jgi:4-carboxymuconolactone decarboxylase
LVAAHHRSDFEWYAHEAVGRANGLSDDELAELKAFRLPGSCSPDERAVGTLSTQLLAERRLTQQTRDSAISVLGIHGVTEVVVLIGYYQTLDLLMQAWETPLPLGVKKPFETIHSFDQAGDQ